MDKNILKATRRNKVDMLLIIPKILNVKKVNFW